MVIEIFLAAILSFGIGSYVTELKKEKEATSNIVKKERQPDVWPPVDHDKLLRTCGIMCGEGRFKTYNSIYGKCECVATEAKEE